MPWYNVVGFIDMAKCPGTGYSNIPASFWHGEAMTLDAALTRANRMASVLWDAHVAVDPAISEALRNASEIKVYKLAPKPKHESKGSWLFGGLVEVCATRYGSVYDLHMRLLAFPTGLRWIKVHELGTDVRNAEPSDEYKEAKREMAAYFGSSGRL